MLPTGSLMLIINQYFLTKLKNLQTYICNRKNHYAYNEKRGGK